MHFVILGLAILVVALIAACCGRNSSGPPVADGDKVSAPGKLHTRDRSRKEIMAALGRLRDAPAPEKLSMGAMCYSIMMKTPLDTIDYVCLDCGEKTVYDRKGTGRREGLVEMVESVIPSCRRWFKSIEGLDCRLIESPFCASCSPNVTKPGLAIEITYPGGTKHRVEGVTPLDLQLLAEFTQGKNVHIGARDVETPLKKYADRLAELLGAPR